MKKLLTIVLALALVLSFGAGCKAKTTSDLSVIRVGASITPHAEILAAVKDQLAEAGYTLEIVEFTDYVLPNTSLESGELDANYFQHQPYLTDFNEKHDTHIVSIGSIHYEPFGIYAGKTASIEELADGATIAVPNDSTNEARALWLLAEQGLITLKKDAGFDATVRDIVENPKNLNVIEIEAAQLVRSLLDVDLAVINGNYAIQGGLNAITDALATEAADSESAQTFANILCVKEGNENIPALQALLTALTSETCKTFINETYGGAVIPLF